MWQHVEYNYSDEEEEQKEEEVKVKEEPQDEDMANMSKEIKKSTMTLEEPNQSVEIKQEREEFEVLNLVKGSVEFTQPFVNNSPPPRCSEIPKAPNSGKELYKLNLSNICIKPKIKAVQPGPKRNSIESNNVVREFPKSELERFTSPNRPIEIQIPSLNTKPSLKRQSQENSTDNGKKYIKLPKNFLEPQKLAKMSMGNHQSVVIKTEPQQNNSNVNLKPINKPEIANPSVKIEKKDKDYLEISRHITEGVLKKGLVQKTPNPRQQVILLDINTKLLKRQSVPFKCPICNGAFTSLSLFKVHFDVEHENDLLPGLESYEEKMCLLCGTGIQKGHTLYEHVLTKHLHSPMVPNFNPVIIPQLMGPYPKVKRLVMKPEEVKPVRKPVARTVVRPICKPAARTVVTPVWQPGMNANVQLIPRRSSICLGCDKADTDEKLAKHFKSHVCPFCLNYFREIAGRAYHIAQHHQVTELR